MKNNKNWLFTLILIGLFAFGISGCDNDTTDEENTEGTNNGNNNGSGSNSSTNEFSFNGETYKFTSGNIDYFGNYYSESAKNMEISINSNSKIILIDILVPNEKNILVSGTYNYSDEPNENFPPFSFCSLIIQNEMNTFNLNSVYKSTGGTVIVTVSGSGEQAIYTISVNCPMKDFEGNLSGNLTGKYIGKLSYTDYSD